MSSDKDAPVGVHHTHEYTNLDTSNAWRASRAASTLLQSPVTGSYDPEALKVYQHSGVHSEEWCTCESDETLNSPSDSVRRDSFGSEKAQQPTLPPAPVGFWSPGLLKTRRVVFTEYAKTLSILCIFVFVVLSIYWGVLASIYHKLERATVAVVNFDGLDPYQDTVPLVGPAVLAEVRAQLLVDRHLGYQIRSPSEFDNDPMNVRLAVHDEKYWAAIIVNRNATALLRQAVETGNASYDPLGAGQIIYNQARDVENFNQYVIPSLTALATEISLKFGRNWTSTVLTDSSFDAAIYSRVPQALSPAISFTLFNLRPFDPPTAIPTISIGLIYLIIIAFFSFGFFMPTHMKFVLPNPASPHPPLKFNQLVVWRYVATIFAYFCMSLFYSFVSLAFQIPFSNSPPSVGGVTPQHWPKTEVVNNADYLGKGTFIVYWMLNFTGMGALGLACENMAMLLGTPWTALWLIFWVITNVSTGFYNLELASDFYRWGYAWPLRQIVLGSRALLFGTKDTLGLNFGILIVWVVVGTALFPVCCRVLRWKNMQEKKRLAAVHGGTR